MTKIWEGQFALASPYSKFWGDLSPAFPPMIYAHAWGKGQAVGISYTRWPNGEDVSVQSVAAREHLSTKGTSKYNDPCTVHDISARSRSIGQHSIQGWLDIYRYISPIYIIDIYISDIFVRKYRIFSIYFRYFQFFIEFSQIFFNVTHCDYVLIFSLCFAGLWLVPSAFSQCWTTSVRFHLSTAMQCE